MFSPTLLIFFFPYSCYFTKNHSLCLITQTAVNGSPSELKRFWVGERSLIHTVFFFFNSVKVFIVLATFGGDLDHYSPSINELGCEQDWELELRTIYLFILLFSWGKIMISLKNFLEWLSKSNLKSHSKSCDAPLSSSPPVIVLTLPWQWHPIWTQL